MKMYYLMPTAEQNQKSFYGKAVVAIDDNGTETLFLTILKLFPDCRTANL